jgi:Flp pilus assembly protein TadG
MRSKTSTLEVLVLIELIARLFASTKGAVAVTTAIAFPILLGFSALGIEVGHWYLVQRQMQGAADAAAISAAAQYVQDQVANNTTSTAYQSTGQYYANYNGFSIPLANTCLMTLSGDNCAPVRALDARPIQCDASPCIVVEITQDPLQWLSTKAQLEPTASGMGVKAIPTTILAARAVVSIKLDLTSNTPQGNSCILTLANARNAIQVRGNGDIHANCGLLIDGGRRQNASEAPQACSDGTAPPCGGLTLEGANAFVHISNLTVAASTAGPAESSCPDPNRCFLYNPTTTVLPTSKIFTNVETPDPFAGRTFKKPDGQVVTGVTLVNTQPGSGYTNGTRTFTVVGGTGPAAKFTATVSGGKVTSNGVIVDPGQYTTLPASTVSVVADDGKGSGANFRLTFATCLPGALFPATPVPNRAYCSIPAPKIVNFPTGIYYIEGGEAASGGCAGLCIMTGGPTANVTTDAAGVTFVLTNLGSGTTGPYATMNISSNGTVNLTAPSNNINADGTPCAANCANTTFGMIVFQDRNAPETASLPGGGLANTDPTLNSLSGCGGNNLCRTLSGSLYFPKQTVNFSGNGTVQGTCFGSVSKYMDDAGVPIFQNGCLPGTTGGSGGTGSVTGGTFKLAQ